MRIKIKKLPLDKAAYGKQVDGSLSLKPGAFGGADYREPSDTRNNSIKGSIGAVPRDKANLEAEGGETAFGPISGESIPDHMKIKGKRHHEGGVPLNLPDDTFIFSDTAALKINDPGILMMFNRAPKKGGYTPAELAKPYDIAKYKDILYDKDSGKLEKNTATIMIKNYIQKLGALALVQESMKGFPQGIPEMAYPYMEANNIKEEDLIPELKEQAEAMAQQMPQQGMPQQQMPMEQMPPQEMQGEEMYPEQMPSGAPVASPEALAQMQSMQPGARYGRIMRAQNGVEMNDPAMQDYIKTANEYYFRKGIDQPYYGTGEGQMTPEQIQHLNELNEILNSAPDPRQKLMQMQEATENCPCMQDMLVQGRVKRVCVPCQEDDILQYGGIPYGDYVMPSGYYNYGGLVKAQPGINVDEEELARFSGNQDAYQSYKDLEQMIQNDPELRKALFEQFQGVIKDPSYYTFGQRGMDEWSPGFTDIDEQKLIDALLAQERRNSILRAAGFTASETSQNPYAKGKYINKETLDFINEHPELGLTEDDFASGYLGQAGYIAFNKYMQEQNKDDYDAWAASVGKQDEKVPGMPGVSGIENISSNTTLGEFLYGLKEKEPAAPAKKEKVCKCVDPDTKKVTETIIAENEKCECTGNKVSIPDTPVRQDAPHWSIPAKRNVARNALMSVNPASTNVVLPGRSQVDPTFEEYQTKVDTSLAGLNALAPYLTPAQKSQLMGQALRQGIGAVSDVSARNVNTANQFAIQNATIDNANMLARANALQQALNMQTARKDTRTANVNKRRYNVMGAMNDADREMAKTQIANTLYPQYNIDYDYGFMYPTGVKKPMDGTTSPDFEKRVQHYLEKTGNYKDAFDMAYKENRMSKAREGGYVLASNLFPFII